MDVHPPKNGMYRYWSIAIYPKVSMAFHGFPWLSNHGIPFEPPHLVLWNLGICNEASLAMRLQVPQGAGHVQPSTIAILRPSHATENGDLSSTRATHGGSKLRKFWLLEGISMIPPRKVLAKWGDAQGKMWFLGFKQQQVTSETELAKIGVEATKMGGKQRISILIVGIYSHFYSFYGGTMSRYRIHRHCHMHYTMGSLWVSDTTTFGSHETYFKLYVFGAGHLRRPPLLSVFDITLKTRGGVGWDNSVICCTFSCTCTHTSCYAAVRSHALAHIRHATLLYVLMHLHTYVMLRCCTFSCTCTHTSCYAAVRSHALAHIRHATPLYILMHLHTYVMLRCCTFSCTCTHTSCYAAVRSHALAHIRHATLLYVLMHLHTYVMLRRCTFSCTFTHTSCYAAVRSHALAHIRHATLLYVLMHLHTYVMLRCCTFSCTCTHTSCYAAVRSHALAHIRHATLLYVLMHLHTYVMLRCCTFSCTCTHTSCYAAVRFHALAHIRHATPLYVLMHFQIVGRVLGGWLWICKWWWWWWWWWWNCSWC